MNEAKHTPGPWTTSIGTSGARVHVNNDFNHPLSFGFSYSDIDAEEQAEGQANARLIAAGPELLEACEMALTYLVTHRPEGNIRRDFHAFNEHENDAVKPLRAAIAKATGEPIQP